MGKGPPGLASCPPASSASPHGLPPAPLRVVGERRGRMGVAGGPPFLLILLLILILVLLALSCRPPGSCLNPEARPSGLRGGSWGSPLAPPWPMFLQPRARRRCFAKGEALAEHLRAGLPPRSAHETVKPRRLAFLMLNEFYCLAVIIYLGLDYGSSCSSRSQELLKIPTVRLQFKRSKRAHTACLPAPFPPPLQLFPSFLHPAELYAQPDLNPPLFFYSHILLPKRVELDS